MRGGSEGLRASALARIATPSSSHPCDSFNSALRSQNKFERPKATTAKGIAGLTCCSPMTVHNAPIPLGMLPAHVARASRALADTLTCARPCCRLEAKIASPQSTISGKTYFRDQTAFMPCYTQSAHVDSPNNIKRTCHSCTSLPSRTTDRFPWRTQSFASPWSRDLDANHHASS